MEGYLIFPYGFWRGRMLSLVKRLCTMIYIYIYTQSPFNIVPKRKEWDGEYDVVSGHGCT